MYFMYVSRAFVMLENVQAYQLNVFFVRIPETFFLALDLYFAIVISYVNSLL